MFWTFLIRSVPNFNTIPKLNIKKQIIDEVNHSSRKAEINLFLGKCEQNFSGKFSLLQYYKSPIFLSEYYVIILCAFISVRVYACVRVHEYVWKNLPKKM